MYFVWWIVSDVLRLADALVKEPEVVKLLSDNKVKQCCNSMHY